MDDHILKFLNENFGKIVGGFLGLLIALIIVIFGFWKGIFIIFCILVGIFIGAKVEKHEGLRNFLDRFRFSRERF
ncbi:MAG: DUF2273 domain-containing protein [Dethiobacter sp.]|jgi:uncharacterized membrane protein|nr:MAG: DUF2273 domain-containing protein [Dethiobacter sp.]